MAEKERLTEQIKFQTEMLRLAWLSLLAVTSGVVGLLLGDLNARRLTFAAVGLAAMILFTGFIGHLSPTDYGKY
ncbi:MAG: hypothetical protein AB7P69_09770 [Candidatus Binatia bacterium]